MKAKSTSVIPGLKQIFHSRKAQSSIFDDNKLNDKGHNTFRSGTTLMSSTKNKNSLQSLETMQKEAEINLKFNSLFGTNKDKTIKDVIKQSNKRIAVYNDLFNELRLSISNLTLNHIKEVKVSKNRKAQSFNKNTKTQLRQSRSQTQSNGEFLTKMQTNSLNKYQKDIQNIEIDLNNTNSNDHIIPLKSKAKRKTDRTQIKKYNREEQHSSSVSNQPITIPNNIVYKSKLGYQNDQIKNRQVNQSHTNQRSNTVENVFHSKTSFQADQKVNKRLTDSNITKPTKIVSIIALINYVK